VTLRVALIAWDYPPGRSGLSTAAREIAQGLALAGCGVTVFTADRGGEEADGPVRVVGCAITAGSGLARLRLRGGVGHLAAPLAFRRAVLAAHRREPFDVAEATNWYAPAVLLARTGALPVVTRNSTPAAFSRNPPKTLRDRFDAWTADRLEHMQARLSAGLISNTPDHARRIEAEYGLGVVGPHAVIGLSLPPGRLAAGAAAPYPALGLGEEARLLFVGRAEHRKGFDTILEAVERLGSEAAAPKFRVTLVGVPPKDLPAGLSPRVRSLIEPRGRVPDGELDGEYARAHAVLAPSRYESFGLVYQEAIAFGRPVVASGEDASARRFIGETGAGVLIPGNTGEALAEAIGRVIADGALRLKLRAAALAAAGRFTREDLGAETLALYREAIARFQARKGVRRRSVSNSRPSPGASAS
jgi:glycogen synthase